MTEEREHHQMQRHQFTLNILHILTIGYGIILNAYYMF